MEKRILIVDNDETVLCALERLLGTIGYETETAWSGAQALELLRTQPFDLVLLDDQLSDADAVEMLQQLAALYPFPPVVVTQNIPYSQRKAQRFLGLGASAVVAKCDLEEIEEVVKALVPLSAAVPEVAQTDPETPPAAMPGPSW
ncbi:MAG TPA: response regulator [Terriglobales bacterium]|nr:response regulator [Terriglobales bacterium]